MIDRFIRRAISLFLSCFISSFIIRFKEHRALSNMVSITPFPALRFFSFHSQLMKLNNILHRAICYVIYNFSSYLVLSLSKSYIIFHHFFQNQLFHLNNIINQIILCAVYFLLCYFILLLVIQFQYHQAFDDMVSDMFLFGFISFDRSFNYQHHILRNIEIEISFIVFRSSVSCPISSTLSFYLHSAQNTSFHSLSF